jgi:hypothetical protein
MNTKNVLIALGVIVLLGLGVYFPRTNPVVNQIVGSVPGTSLSSPFWDVNGLTTEYRSQRLNVASTTICSMRSPTYATSTLVFGSVSFTTGTTTVLVVDFGRSTGPGATTTSLGQSYLAAGFTETFIASSTNVGTKSIFAPGTYFNVKVGGYQGDANVLKGSCKGEFKVLSN